MYPMQPVLLQHMPQLLFQDRRDMKRASVGLLTHY